MSEMQFSVITDLAPVEGTVIETNFEAVRDWLQTELAPYQTMAVTPDAIGDAKKTRASIRKVGDNIDAQRKAVKNQWMKPYMAYESKCKELTDIVNKAVNNIDGQIKEMEAAAKEEKRKELEAFFTDAVGDMAEYLSFDDVFTPSWLNATVKAEVAKESITGRIMTTKQEVYAIRNMKSPYVTAMLAAYARTHSLASAIAEGDRMEAFEKAEKERKEKEAQDIPEAPEIATQEAQSIQEPPAAPQTPFSGEEAPKVKLLSFDLRVTGTKEQLFALKRFAKETGIKIVNIGG